jgi:ABC-type antimicrobial peptide transport system permease subunit
MMKIYRTSRTALHALRRNVMRAILTTLGIIIGIAAVIAMMEIGKGSSAAIQKTISSMGANNLLLFPGAVSVGGVSNGAGTGMDLTPQDCDAILTGCPDVRDAAPVVRVHTQVVYGNRNCVPNTMYGTTPAFLNVRDWNQMDQGSAFTDADVRAAASVCVIGETVVSELFPNESPIGKELRVQNVAFKVVGVLSPKGANMMGWDQDDILIAPWTTIKFRVAGTSAQVTNQSAAAASSSGISTAVNTLSNLYPGSVALYDSPDSVQQADTPQPKRFINVDQIMVSAGSPENVQPAIQEVTQLLRERHRIRPADPEDFQLRDMTEMSNALSSTTNLMTTLLLAVACISLLVGGVGIMNIMLVSVTERTREIGLRMAVGARGRDILWQFLVEAVVLCLAGGALGILLGIGTAFLVTYFLSWPTQSSPAAVVSAVVVSAAVGIVFGFYPAWKASRLDPIDALRYE